MIKRTAVLYLLVPLAIRGVTLPQAAPEPAAAQRINASFSSRMKTRR